MHDTPRHAQLGALLLRGLLVLLVTTATFQSDARQAIASDAVPNGSPEQLLNDGLNLLNKRQDAASALPKLQLAAEHLSRATEPDHRLATALDALGQCYEALDRPSDALASYQRSLIIHRRLHPSGHSNLVTCLVAVAFLLESDDPLQALPYHQEALTIQRRLHPSDHPETAACLNRLGYCLRVLGRFEQAIEAQRNSVEMLRRLDPRPSQDLATYINTLGSTLFTAGHVKEALPVFREALHLRRTLPDPDPKGIATSLNNLSQCLSALGYLQEASSCLDEALRIRRAVYPSGHPSIASVLASQAVLFENQHRLRESAALNTEALALRRRVLPEGHPDLLRSLENTALALSRLGRSEEAVSCATELLEFRRKHSGSTIDQLIKAHSILGAVWLELGFPDRAEAPIRSGVALAQSQTNHFSQDVFVCLNNLAIWLQASGRPAEALDVYRTTLEQGRTRGLDATERGFQIRRNMALCLADVGRLDEAAVTLQSLLTEARGRYPEPHPDLAEAYNGVAAAFQDMRRFNDALGYYQEAIAIWKSASSNWLTQTIAIQNNVGTCLRDLGRHKESIEILQQLVDSPALQGATAAVRAAVLGNLGECLNRAGQHTRAVQHLESALDVNRTFLNAVHPDMYRMLNNCAAAHGALNQPRKALDLALEADRILWDLLHRDYTFLTPSQRRQYRERIAREGSPVSWSIAMLDPSSESARPTLDSLLLRKNLLQEITLLERRTLSGTNTSRQCNELLRRRQSIRHRVASRLLASHENPAPDDPNLTALLKEAESIEEGLRACLPTAEAKPSDTPPSFIDVHRALRPGEVLVEFFRFAPPLTAGHDLHYGAVVILPGNLTSRVVDLGSATELDKAVESYLSQIRRDIADWKWISPSPAGAERAERRLSRLASLLTDRIWTPLQLTKPQRVFACTDGALGLVPFEALPSAPTNAETSTRFLIEETEFVRLDTARDFVRFRSTPVQAGTHTTTNTATFIANPPGSRSWPPLPAAESSARKLASALAPRGWSVTTHFGPAADRSAIIHAGSPRLLHIATHGYLTPRNQGALGENPLLRPTLILAPPSRPDPAGVQEQGSLTAYEIATLDLHATELVNLVACETAIGESMLDEGISSLHSAFLAAGARSLVASLWEIPELEMTRQSEEFLRAWLGMESSGTPTTRISAFRQAQLRSLSEARTKRGTSHPFFWAGSVYIGDPGDTH